MRPETSLHESNEDVFDEMRWSRPGSILRQVPRNRQEMGGASFPKRPAAGWKISKKKQAQVFLSSSEAFPFQDAPTAVHGASAASASQLSLLDHIQQPEPLEQSPPARLGLRSPSGDGGHGGSPTMPSIYSSSPMEVLQHFGIPDWALDTGAPPQIATTARSFPSSNLVDILERVLVEYLEL